MRASKNSVIRVSHLNLFAEDNNQKNTFYVLELAFAMLGLMSPTCVAAASNATSSCVTTRVAWFCSHLTAIRTGRTFAPRPVSCAVPPGRAEGNPAPEGGSSAIVGPVLPRVGRPPAAAGGGVVRESAAERCCRRRRARNNAAVAVVSRVHEARRRASHGAVQVGGTAGYLDERLLGSG